MLLKKKIPDLQNGMKRTLIMAWLWNSMVPEITDTYMFLNSAKEIRNAMEQTYSKAKDAAQIYDVKVKTIISLPNRETRLL